MDALIVIDMQRGVLTKRARFGLEGVVECINDVAQFVREPQVNVNHVDEAEEIFSTLMGDVAEPRREFIEQNALNVANLDV